MLPTAQTPNATPLVILGTRTFAEEVADLASEVPGITFRGFVENLDPLRCNDLLDGMPIHWIDDLAWRSDGCMAVCALSTTSRNRFTEQVEAAGVEFYTLRHPWSRVSTRSTLGAGSIVSPGVVVASHTKIGRHAILNRGVLIGHHTEIGDYVTIQPGANVAGGCRIGPHVYIGMGAVIRDHVCIGANAVVGAGAVVVKDVPENVQVLGVPARIVKTNPEGK